MLLSAALRHFIKSLEPDRPEAVRHHHHPAGDKAAVTLQAELVTQ